MKKLFLTAIAFLTVGSLLSQNVPVQDSVTSKKLIYLCKIDKMIAAPLWRTVKRSFDEADSLRADYILIHMNTYGGQVDIADSIRTL
ncbi:MAG: nodulation protein NfeD, partial [Bacteroidales bacterium]|nr:nodulation protein NfeD [Bacteroidales bacterium]